MFKSRARTWPSKSAANRTFGYSFFTALAIGFIESGYAQTLAEVNVAAVSTTDSIIAALPGVLIAGLALVFAIREHGALKRMRQELFQTAEEKQTLADSASCYRVTAEYSAAGFMETGCSWTNALCESSDATIDRDQRSGRLSHA